MKFHIWYCLLLLPFLGNAQTISNSEIAELIKEYRVNDRGPYKDIRWFCPNDSIQMPKKPCAEKGGNQRARYKDQIVALAENQHIFLGQILATTKFDDFWDAKNDHARLKQYELEQFLKAQDDGWILERGRYYRGAVQVEDERAWGKNFLLELLAKIDPINEKFFLVRQTVKSLPHTQETKNSYNVRAVSKNISEAYPAFQDLRVKIHGQPEASDIERVQSFQQKHARKISTPVNNQMEQLLEDMRLMYRPVDLMILEEFLAPISSRYPIKTEIKNYITEHRTSTTSPSRITATAELLLAIREALPIIKSAELRLALLDISILLEELYFKEIATWKPTTTANVMDKICYTTMASTGAGFLERWEWEAIEGQLAVPLQSNLSLKKVNDYLATARRVVEWGTGMVNSTYGEVIETFAGFEPLAKDFSDEIIRSSVLLRLGQQVSNLGSIIAEEAGFSNQVFSLANQSAMRGLNPGYAVGKLVVIDEYKDEIPVQRENIYVFRRPPSELKPVAGIATVTEGNMVSHVQLLARNLGIPNAVISIDNLSDLKAYEGKEVFYAVSNEGTVLMKLAKDRTQREKDLFTKQERDADKITVPTDKINLEQTQIVNMRAVDATASGVLCGPKAANLGQLKALFPEYVVEGLVIPFGIFRQHLDQKMPRQDASYWSFLQETFLRAEGMLAEGKTVAQKEDYILGRLEMLQKAIKNIQLSDEFLQDLEASFKEAFGTALGNTPVFLRSDTNMEDLAQFTGAGLNLTKFNVVNKEAIIKGIKEVWASPYSDRSFKWRQRYLLNPENVFPSILIIPTVDVDHSGVMITKGVTTQDGRDVTVAFSRGAGGAVDGQAAETYLLANTQENILLSPAREANYRRLPINGGSIMKKTTFESPILSQEELYELRKLAYHIHHQFPKNTDSETHGPFDIELGFKDGQPWLFQVRPFVENNQAKASEYLQSITPYIDGNKKIRIRAEDSLF